MNDPDPVELYHYSTNHGEPPPQPDRRTVFKAMDPGNRPAPFKQYEGLEQRLLPRRLLRSEMQAVHVLSGQSGGQNELDWKLLGTLLFLSAGVSRVRGSPEPWAWYRMAMSAGNLHPIEVYVLYEGLWHYEPREHALVRLREPTEVAPVGENGAALILTGIPFRTCWKYRDRGWRHLFWDAGTLSANALAVATAHGLHARVDIGFDDDAVSQLVGIEAPDELPIALISLGASETPIPPAGSLAPILAESSPVAPHPIRFPLIEEAQAAGTLPEAALGEWRESLVAAGGPPRPTSCEPPVNASTASLEEVVRLRGSTRRFRTEVAAPAELLEWAMSAAVLAIPRDVGTGTFLKHFLSVHAVEGHRTGSALWQDQAGLAQLGAASDEEEERAAARHLCLNQALGGTSAYTVFHCSQLQPLLSYGGARGYRAAQLEAGVVSGRLALCAVAIGAGATGLTFFDKEVADHFATEATPMLVTAVGVPTTPHVRGGLPRCPVVMRG